MSFTFTVQYNFSSSMKESELSSKLGSEEKARSVSLKNFINSWIDRNNPHLRISFQPRLFLENNLKQRLCAQEMCVRCYCESFEIILLSSQIFKENEGLVLPYVWTPFSVFQRYLTYLTSVRYWTNWILEVFELFEITFPEAQQTQAIKSETWISLQLKWTS